MITRRWEGETVTVAATGPSLNAADGRRGGRIIAVNDAWRIIPHADVLYACDNSWWRAHKGCPDFAGEKWSCHEAGPNDKLEAGKLFGLHLVNGRYANGFSTDPSCIHYGHNSGFQAVNLAILFGAARVLLAGFDMRQVAGKRHFFGDHPKPLRNVGTYGNFIEAFERAAENLPIGVEIINVTPGSALRCFPFMDELCQV